MNFILTYIREQYRIGFFRNLDFKRLTTHTMIKVNFVQTYKNYCNCIERADGKFPAGVMCLLFFGDERYADVGDSGDAQVAKTRSDDDAVERVESAFLFDNERFLVGRAESLA